jgi:mono/diheme cytochrome c family protein
VKYTRPPVRRPLLIALCIALLAGCGGEETVSPTGPVEGTLPQQEAGNPTAGKTVYADAGCAACHTFTPAGSTGKTGPNLDTSLQGKDEDYVRESIVDPDAEIAPGFQPGIMPKNYGQQLNSKQIADLVAFLRQSGK